MSSGGMDSDGAREDARLPGLIGCSCAPSHGIYGARRIFGDLREAGKHCGLHRIKRSMRVNDIKLVCGCKKPRPIVGRPSIIAPNRLQRQFNVDAPDVVRVTDIT